MTSIRYIITRSCLQDGSMRLLKYNEGHFPQSGPAQFVDEKGTEHAVHIDRERMRVTGLRNPCAQVEAFAPGLLECVVEKTDGATIRKAGVMAIVVEGGPVMPGDPIISIGPAGPHIPLERV